MAYDHHDCGCKKDCDCKRGRCAEFLTGPQGPQGIQGVRGEQGEPGVRGMQGIQGIQGEMGPQGVKGDPGDCVNCPGEKGDKGDPGPMGPIGLTGPKGDKGDPGEKGDRGETGLPGPTGPMGPQGIPGDVSTEFCEMYSTSDQQLAASPGPNLPGGVVRYEHMQVATPAFDVSMAASTGEIKVLRAGWYRINKAVSGALNPLFSPLKVWSLSIFKNGQIIPASTFGDMTISPEQRCNQTVSIVIVHLEANDIITMANTSDSPLNLNSETFGSTAVPLSADINFSLLRAGHTPAP